MDHSWPGSSVHGLLQARILERGAFPFSGGSSQSRDQTQVFCIAGRFSPVWATSEAPKHQSGQPIPSPVDLPDPGVEPGSPVWQEDSLPAELPGKSMGLLSSVQFFETLWTVVRQSSLSMRFPSQEYWSVLPFPSPGDLLDPEIKPASPALADGFLPTEPPGKPF